MFGITMAESGGEFVAPGPNSFDFSEVPLFHLGGLAVMVRDPDGQLLELLPMSYRSTS